MKNRYVGRKPNIENLYYKEGNFIKINKLQLCKLNFKTVESTGLSLIFNHRWTSVAKPKFTVNLLDVYKNNKNFFIKFKKNGTIPYFKRHWKSSTPFCKKTFLHSFRNFRKSIKPTFVKHKVKLTTLKVLDLYLELNKGFKYFRNHLIRIFISGMRKNYGTFKSPSEKVQIDDLSFGDTLLQNIKIGRDGFPIPPADEDIIWFGAGSDSDESSGEW